MTQALDPWKSVYAKIFIGSLAVLIVGALGYWAWESYTVSRELRLQAEYARIEAEILKASNSSPESGSNPSEKAKAPTPPSAEQKSQWKQELMKIVEQEPSSVAAGLASLKIYDLSDSPDWTLAEKALKLSKKDSQIIGGLTTFAYANVLAELDRCEEANRIWQEVVGKAQWSALAKESELRQALCLQKLGKKDEARALFQKLAQEKEFWGLSRQAQKLSREALQL
ncbi:MAG: hypothetical protein WCH11_01325 [Bdellovibrio sp.]